MRAVRSALALMLLGTLAACSGGSDDGPPPMNVRLFGTTYGASQLVELDPVTGALLDTVGPVGYRVNGLEYDHTTGKLFATTSSGDVNFPDGLIEIDMATGAGTPIGTGAGMLVNNPTVNSAGRMFAWTENSDNAVTLDKTTGVATEVGASGLDTWEHGLAFDTLDRLVFVNGDGEYFSIDTVTGLGTSLGNLGMRLHHGDFHPGTGLYWGIDATGAGAKNLYTANIGTGAVSDPLPTAADLMAITFTR